MMCANHEQEQEVISHRMINRLDRGNSYVKCLVVFLPTESLVVNRLLDWKIFFFAIKHFSTMNWST